MKTLQGPARIPQGAILSQLTKRPATDRAALIKMLDLLLFWAFMACDRSLIKTLNYMNI